MSGKSFKTLIVAILLAVVIAIAPLSPGATTVVLAEGCNIAGSGCPSG
mgnify:FL=1